MTLDTRARRAAQGIHRAVEVMEMSTFTKEPRKVERFDRFRDRKQRNRRIGAILVAAALVITAVVIVSKNALDRGQGTVPATPTELNGRIVYGVFDQATETSQLFTINPDGTDLVDLSLVTDPGADEWSGDGSRLLVSSSAVPGSSDALRPATINPDGSGYTVLDATVDRDLNLGGCIWSPDGTRLACNGFNEEGVVEANGFFSIRSSDGGDLVRLTDVGYNPLDYSPDGTRILAYLGTSRDGFRGELVVLNADGTGARAITPPRLVWNLNGSWSPDGRWIAFASTFEKGCELYLVHPDGTGLHQITFDADAGLQCAIGPTWSPDGTLIAFVGNVFGSDGDIYTVRPDGSDLVQVTDTLGIAEGDLDWGTNTD